MVSTSPSPRMTTPLPSLSVPSAPAVKASSGTVARTATTERGLGLMVMILSCDANAVAASSIGMPRRGRRKGAYRWFFLLPLVGEGGLAKRGRMGGVPGNANASLRWNTPQPSRRAAPIHLLPQGEKEEPTSAPT